MNSSLHSKRSRRLFSRRFLPVLVLFAALLAACRSPEKATQSSGAIRLALTDTPIPYLPVILAETLGFYRKQHVSVVIDDFSSASRVMQALLGGSADVGAGSYEQLIQVAAENRPVRQFLLMLRYQTRVLVVQPKAASRIKRIEDLKGATVGVAGLGSINHLFLNYVLMKHGVKPSEVKPVGIGTATSAIAAVDHALVEAAVLSGSESSIVIKHNPGLAILLDARGPSGCRSIYGSETCPATGLYATNRWLQEHREEARRLARAVLSTLAWIARHSPEEVYAAIPSRYRSGERDAELEALRLTMASYSRDGRMQREGAETVREALSFTLENVRRARFDLASTYTNEFVDAKLP